MNEKWMRDTGLVLGLLCLVLGYSGNKSFLIASGILVALAMLVPKALYPLAWVWLKLVFLLGWIMPKVFFGIVFFLVIFPVGAIRTFMKKDALLLRNWKEAKTVFWDRDVRFGKQHLENPY